MNPFRKIANSLMNWWKGETAPEVSDSTELTGGVMTLNSPSFLESMGLSRRRKTTSEVTYFTCMSSRVGAYRTGVLIMGKSTLRGGFSETKRTANMFSRWIFDTFSRVLTMMS